MPESLEDPVLGPLKWDDRLQWWVGEAALLPDRSVPFMISPDREREEDVLGRVRISLARIKEHQRAYRNWTAEQVLNRRWNTEEPMSVLDIAELLRLASLDFHPDGGVGLYWGDQDRLFGGHNLITEVDANGQFVQVRMEG